MPEISTRARTACCERDWWSCVRCGGYLAVGNRQVQHRVPRGMGGRVGHDALSHLVLLCGFSSTDPDGCHAWAEADRPRAERAGLVVPDGEDPTTWPVLYSMTHGGGWWVLDDDGDRRRVA